MTENRLVMVSEWMDNGNICEFLRAKTDVNLFELVCSLSRGPYIHVVMMITWLSQLGDVTTGLTYMHDQGIVHGDLKGVRHEPSDYLTH